MRSAISPRKIGNIVELMKLAALVEDFPPKADRIHLSNGRFFWTENLWREKPKSSVNRFPVAYNPGASKPILWLKFLDGLLYPEDIPTLQEYIGYCLIPSNKGQRMMVMKGNGGEGKSQIGAVLGALFDSNMKDGSIGKISRRTDLPVPTWSISSCVWTTICGWKPCARPTMSSPSSPPGQDGFGAQGQAELSGMDVRPATGLLHGDLQALFDRSDGFYRRQLVLTTRDKPAGRVDDPDLAEKMKPRWRAYCCGPLRACSGWLPTTSSLPRASAPKTTGKLSNGITTMYMIFWNPMAISG